jgi:hypothetical protein
MGCALVALCPSMGTDIEVGPTGRQLLPLTVVGQGRDQVLADAPGAGA